MPPSAPETLRLRIVMVTVFGLGLAIQALSLLAGDLDKHVFLRSLPVHGAIEMAGSVIAAMVAYLLLRLHAIGEGSSFNHQIAAALLAMSGLDGLHAMMPDGESFVWLHSLATAFGGLLFAMIWLPGHWFKPVMRHWPLNAFLMAAAMGIYSILQPGQIPQMLASGQFTQAAVIMNIGGGLFLLLAAVKLFLTYRHSAKSEDLLFFFQCLILASAAITFMQSSIWDMPWWGWHMQRLAGYTLTLWLVVKTAKTIEGKTLLSNRLLKQQIEDRKQAENQLRIAATAFETHEAIMITDAHANIIRVNQAFQNITGYSPEDVIGKNPRVLSSGRQGSEFYAAMWKRLLGSGSWTGEIWDKRKNGEVYPKWLTITAVKDNEGVTTEYVAIFSDITLRKHAEEEIYTLAFYDSLTKLPNRRHLLDRINQARSISARSNHYGALLFLDMDRFKILNDTLGHDYGDLFLVEVSRRMRNCVRDMDTVARIGGDEFVVLIEEIGTDNEEVSTKVALIAEKIRAALTEPYLLKDKEHHSSPSIGVCLYLGNEESVDTLLRHADLAMYQAKESGRNGVRFFDPAMQLAVETRAALEADMRHAVTGKQLRLYYQIQLTSDHRPLGAEALIRWMHPVRGLVSPAQFIPIAEESSLILEIGHWVLETACKQLVLWSKHERTRNLILAINVSAQQFNKHDFVDTVSTLLHLHQLNPNRLKLELTESVVLSDVADVVSKMHALKALGVKLALDDFGTGYSSLSYLKQLPLDQIKIDRSFVSDVTTDPSDAVMVQTIINLAHNFRMNVIAEGVETEDQLNFLKQNGCMAYQGFLFGKPMPIDEFEALLGQTQTLA
ncbi:bifunctional diguanylate cyclase/phosphodiesterase [Sideroxydans lithotrophicus]|uniref:Diguanylate cyclase/phosphodiesterase with PAS/PAC sensor(S) n=1 Tax=Sideroxydans lithotrophicus (strain ES-1) TaxID=580332 RepID=D5CR33_SIDLE|nr:EAL domain-containing protein [Sideroxydans lithotrophicus]ADE11419.1 diguanylate cyclase/phosphodiesterase with PAS/PAC sensor(s) [Sideroxydans lithotrophicus ES-1]